ncbi:MAG: hypothetical protein J0M12_11040 [Deltaproteobacteria bacterium]|nr:hypothetical protein [Deltaproteobacteria bacterium]
MGQMENVGRQHGLQPGGPPLGETSVGTQKFSLASLAKLVESSPDDHLARLYSTHAAEIRSLLTSYSESLAQGARVNLQDFKNFTSIVCSFGSQQCELSPSHAVEVTHLVRPLLNNKRLMEQPGAWELPLLCAQACAVAGQITQGCDELSRVGNYLVKTFAGLRDREVVGRGVALAGDLAEQALFSGHYEQARAVAALMASWTWNPKDEDRLDWRACSRFLAGKCDLAEQKFDHAVKAFREASQLTKDQPERLPGVAGLLHSAEGLAMQEKFQKQPHKVLEWLAANPIPADAAEGPCFRLRAGAYYSSGRSAAALEELGPILKRKDVLKAEAPYEAAQVLALAAFLHEEIGEAKAAWPLSREAADLFAACSKPAEELNARAQHLKLAWELEVSGDELYMAALDLLGVAETCTGCSEHLVHAHVAMGYALQRQESHRQLVENSFAKAFAVARALEDPSGALMYTHYGYACALYGMGDLDDALRNAEEARAMFDRSSAEREPNKIAHFESLIAGAALHSGDMRTFSRGMERLKQLAKRMDCDVAQGLIRNLEADRQRILDGSDPGSDEDLSGEP